MRPCHLLVGCGGSVQRPLAWCESGFQTTSGSASSAALLPHIGLVGKQINHRTAAARQSIGWWLFSLDRRNIVDTACHLS